MPFRSEATPKQLAMMAKVLDEHCAAHAIAVDSAAHETLARRILYLFSTGVSDAALLAALIAPKRV